MVLFVLEKCSLMQYNILTLLVRSIHKDHQYKEREYYFCIKDGYSDMTMYKIKRFTC